MYFFDVVFQNVSIQQQLLANQLGDLNIKLGALNRFCTTTPINILFQIKNL